MTHGRPRTREDWQALADAMLAAVRPYASPGHARIVPPADAGGYGRDVDGLEGFARTFLLAGFRAAGEGADVTGDLAWYAEGLATGTDPASTERWPRLDEHPQAKVEAALLAWILDLTRPLLWDGLDTSVQRRVVDYLAPAVGDDTYPPINWVWFRLAVQTFLRSVDGPHSLSEMRADLRTHDGFLRRDGWVADGTSRSFDHYVGWMLALFPTIWAGMRGSRDLAEQRADVDRARLDRYLVDAVRLIGADGSPLIQGRSLIYRFAAAAPFWVGALAGVPTVPPGQLRRAASGVVGHFLGNGAFDERGLLTMGWHREWRPMAQSYSGPSSPYWGSLGLLGIALPRQHAVWQAEEAPLPVDESDALFAVAAPGWIASATSGDGVVRIINHGTDHARPGDAVGDSPLYARMGYSTATAPLMDAEAWRAPADNALCLRDGAGRRTHRAGMRLAHLRVHGTGHGAVGVGASRVAPHWLAPQPAAENHGYGRGGAATGAGAMVAVSFVRGPWELRAWQVEEAAPDVADVLVSGWPLVGPVTTHNQPGGVAITDGRLVSRLEAVLGRASFDVALRVGASPLGDEPSTAETRIPQAVLPLEPGRWQAVLVSLGGPAPMGRTTADLSSAAGTVHAAITWPDGAHSEVHLDLAHHLHPDKTPST